MTTHASRGPRADHARPLVSGLLAFGLAVSFSACSSMEGRFPPPASVPMTASAVAEAALFDGVAWQPIPLELRVGANVVGMRVVDDTIYVVDSSATAHAINLETGTHRWIVKLDRLPTQPPAVGAGHVAFLSRNHLTVATRSSGTVVLRTALEFTPSSPAALGQDTLFAGSWGAGTKLRAVSTQDGWHGWFYQIDGPITAAPAIAGSGADQMVYFASEDSQVVALEPRSAAAAPPSAANWKTRTLGRNSADLVADAEALYVASEDHALYCFNRASGVLRWKWLGAQAPLVAAPELAADTVYQPIPGGVAAIDKASGEERYRYAGAERFLTRVGQRDYFRLDDGAVAVVDSASGRELTMVRTPLFDFLPANAGGAALVFSDGKNIYCAR